MHMTLDPRSLAIFATLVVLIMAAGILVANAQYAPTYRSTYVPDYLWDAHEWRDVSHRRRNYRRRPPPYRGSYEADGGRCKSAVAVVGDQYASEAGAKDEARKAWMQSSRWAYGERYMPIDNAEGITFECGRSSVGSVVGQVFYRCRLTARPCRAEPQRESR